MATKMAAAEANRKMLGTALPLIVVRSVDYTKQIQQTAFVKKLRIVHQLNCDLN